MKDRDFTDDHLWRAMAISFGWATERDGFEKSGDGVEHPAEAPTETGQPAPSPRSFSDRLLALAQEAAEMGLWQTPRLIFRTQQIAKAEMAKVLGDELAPSAAHRAHEDSPNGMILFNRRKR